MSLLREIQASLMAGEAIGPVLLKLRFLASRLGSNLLEVWVKHESEGYPAGVDLPPYRRVGVSYIGFFSGPFGSGIKNAPIPSAIIDQHAGKGWTNYAIRQGVSSIDELVSNSSSGVLTISASNLILLLQGHVYENYACNSIEGQISKASLVEIQNAVRARVLELTIEIEKSIPTAADISLGPVKLAPTPKETETVSQITNQVIHGNYTNIANSGAGAQFQLSVSSHNAESVSQALEEAGISSDDAKAIAKIFESENPDSKEEPFGKKAKAWIAANISKAANGTWKAGVAVATHVLTEAALKYYGLK
ncbi:MAG: hypothetical protein WBQ17_12330 [Rhizomicrobium sp.]